MRKRVRNLAIAGIIVAAVVPWSIYEVRSQEKPVESVIPPRLTGLIQNEMRLIVGALTRIVQAVVVGDHQVVAEQSRNIHRSSLLGGATNNEERTRLSSSLAQAFVALDQKLHRQAEKLAAAADDRKVDLERYYLSEMIETCVHCHRVFAEHRFSSLRR